MGNVYDFPPGPRPSREPAFLNDAGDLVQFGDPDGQASRSGGDMRGERPPSAALDWDNQELANIYRVLRLLDAAGCPASFERGVGDEGDPWCVFCRADGEVFIHLCRIDGIYLLDSPNLDRPLVGTSFKALIDSFTQGALGAADGAETASARVVKLSRTDNVFLHPATMLAALIWTIYLQSEDLTLLQVDDAESAAGLDWIAALGAPAETDPMGDAVSTPEGVGIRAEDDAEAGLPTAPRTDGRAEARTEAQADQRVAVGDTGSRDVAWKGMLPSPVTGVAAGLSSIAIACGLMSELSVTGDGEPTLAFLGGDEPGGVETADDVAAAHAQAGDASADGAALAKVLDTIILAARSATDDDAATAVADADAETATAALAGAVPLLPVPGEKPAEPQVRPVDAAEAPPEVAERETASTLEAQSQAEIAAADGAEPGHSGDEFAESGSHLSFEDVKRFVYEDLKPVSIGGVTVEATFDVPSASSASSLMVDVALAVLNSVRSDDGSAVGTGQSPRDAVGESGDAATPEGSDPSPAVAPEDSPLYAALVDYGVEIARESWETFTLDRALEFDKRAQQFFGFLKDKSDEVEVVVGANEIHLIDFAALESETLQKQAVFMKWELAEGGTVTTLGTHDDYLAFDLIA